MLICVTGLNASGKTEVVRFLERRSFYSLSLSDLIREELAREKLEPTRERMIERGRQLRERFGPRILAERARGRLATDRNHVIDSIRHPAEVEELREAGKILLLWIDASPGIRFERSSARNRVGDPRSFDEFQKLEAKELSNEDEARQQLLRVRELADEVIDNNDDVKSLHLRLEEVLKRVLPFQARPSWDEYFMSIARVVASRSNCVKRRVGSIIVSDRRIIATGYVPFSTIVGSAPRCTIRFLFICNPVFTHLGTAPVRCHARSARAWKR